MTAPTIQEMGMIVEEMVRMILAQRAYEINSKAIQTSDEMLSTLTRMQ
jgi:flagellar basal-body rod protein FlgG